MNRNDPGRERTFRRLLALARLGVVVLAASRVHPINTETIFFPEFMEYEHAASLSPEGALRSRELSEQIRFITIELLNFTISRDTYRNIVQLSSDRERLLLELVRIDPAEAQGLLDANDARNLRSTKRRVPGVRLEVFVKSLRGYFSVIINSGPKLYLLHDYYGYTYDLYSSVAIPRLLIGATAEKEYRFAGYKIGDSFLANSVRSAY
jgi:hypothetical protein